MPFDPYRLNAGLADAAHERLQALFAGYGHVPSGEQWAALRDLLGHLECAAAGTLKPALYVSPIPCGTGKSQSLAAFTTVLLDRPDLAHVGALIAVSRIEEVADMADTLEEISATLNLGTTYRDRLCIIVGNAAANDAVRAKGDQATANEAQVVITTQASLKLALKHAGDDYHDNPAFDRTDRFHYQRARRAVVCWDEQVALSRPVVLDSNTAVSLSEAMSRQSAKAATALKLWSVEVDRHEGEHIAVPDFTADFGISFEQLEADTGDDDKLLAAVKALAAMEGDQGRISRQGEQAAIITHIPEVPRSLMPAIVTDASAAVNPRYHQMNASHPETVRWLKAARKTYRNLRLRVVNTAASRSTYRERNSTQGRDLLDMVARYVASVPKSEPVLVIGYRGTFNVRGVTDEDLKAAGVVGKDLRAALFTRLAPDDRDRVKWLAYGHHTATNTYERCRHVVLMGLNYQSQHVLRATSAASKGIDLATAMPSPEDIIGMRDGMLMSDTLQAVLRGNARISIGDGDCGHMEVVIPQIRQAGLSDAQYRTIFPEVDLVHDTVLMPNEKPLKGRAKELAGLVDELLSVGITEIANPMLYESMEMAQQNFDRLVKRDDWKKHIKRLGLVHQKLTGNVKGLRLMED